MVKPRFGLIMLLHSATLVVTSFYCELSKYKQQERGLVTGHWKESLVNTSIRFSMTWSWSMVV